MLFIFSIPTHIMFVLALSMPHLAKCNILCPFIQTHFPRLSNPLLPELYERILIVAIS